MFSRDRFSLSRFSLGSQDNTILIEETFTEDLKQVSGVAIPIETTAFFNDIIRGTLRGAIAMKASFESYSTLSASVTMNANIVVTDQLSEALQASVDGSKNEIIETVLSENLERMVHGSKTMPSTAIFGDALLSETCGVKDVLFYSILNDTFMCITEASSQTTEMARIDVTIPPGSELRIDSETYRALLDGNNILYAQNGDWIVLARELLYLDIESASGGSLDGVLIYTERYL